MPKLRVHNFAISIDGYAAGPDQDIDNPIGVGGPALHEWVFATRAWHERQATDGGTAGLDDKFLEEGDAGIGATIMGRNMFGPIRGESGPTKPGPGGGVTIRRITTRCLFSPPSTRTDHDERGTTFHFVDDGIEAALQRAFEAAEGRDVRLGGGVATIQQYLRAGLVDEMHLAIVPVLLGSGERLFDGIDTGSAAYECVELVSSPNVVHARFARTAATSR